MVRLFPLTPPSNELILGFFVLFCFIHHSHPPPQVFESLSAVGELFYRLTAHVGFQPAEAAGGMGLGVVHVYAYDRVLYISM